MTNLKRLALALSLMSVLAVVSLAGEIPSPPGATPAPPCAPGETGTPPCSSQSVTDDSTAPGEMTGPPASATGDVISIAEAALWSLSLSLV